LGYTQKRFNVEAVGCHDLAVIANVDAAARSLDGTSLGDAFGETWFFRPAQQMQWLIKRLEPQGPWPWTDDTAMAVRSRCTGCSATTGR